MSKLTPEQISNWRKILEPEIGPYALIMDEYEVERFKDDYQRRIDGLMGSPNTEPPK